MSGRIGQRLGAAALAVVALVASAGVPAGAATPDQVSVSAVPATTTPFVRDGQVRAIAVFPTRVVLGGDFTSVRNRATGSPVVTRRFLLAFNRQTGLVDTAFVPVLDGPVEALAPGPDGASVLVGGSFDEASGRVVGGLTRIALASGAPLAGFTATTDGNVDTLKVIGTTAYVGGTFGKINGLVRTRLAAVSTISGAVSPSLTVPVTASQNASAPSRVEKLAVDPAGTRLVIAGNFLQVAGQPRSQIAMIDLTTSPASLATWSTVRFNRKQCAQTYNSDIRDLEVSPDGSYFVAGTTGAWGGTASMCDTASRWELARSGPGQQPSWVQFTGGDTITSVAVTGGGVYLGGHFRWMNNALTPVGDVAGPGAVVRQGLAALDPRTGAPLAWNPTRQLGYGVLDMVPTDDGLYIGHDTDLVGHLVNSRVAFFPTVGGKPLPAFKDPTLPTMLFTADGAGRVARRAFNGVAAPSAPVGVATSEAWGQARGIFAAGGWIYSGWSDGVLRRRTFDGGQFGPVASAQSWWDTRGIRSAMYTGGRLYYTIAGDNELWMRTFDPVSGVVGTLKTSVSGPVNGIAWRSVTGMTYAGGKLVVTTTDGYLRVANATFGISGAPSVTNQHGVSGPNIDGGRWAFVDLFTTPVG